jgi:hypothetical protein
MLPACIRTARAALLCETDTQTEASTLPGTVHKEFMKFSFYQ